MSLPKLIPSARRRIEEARRDGKHLTFHVSKTKNHRWNWTLTMRFLSKDPASGDETLVKVFLQTSKEREPLEMLREYLETAQHAE